MDNQFVDLGKFDTHRTNVDDATPASDGVSPILGVPGSPTYSDDRPRFEIQSVGVVGAVESGQASSVTQVRRAALLSSSSATPLGASGVGHGGSEILGTPADPALIARIVVLWRSRQAWLREEIALTLRAKALCRGLANDGDKAEAAVIFAAATGKGEHPAAADAVAAIFPLLEARDSIAKRRAEIEKLLAKTAKQLPVRAFIEETKGASFNALAAIVGEAGDLGNYANPGKLWKRLGLAPYAGKAYSTWRRQGGLDAAAWEAAGYKPARRAVSFVIGGSLIGGFAKGKRPLLGEDISLRDDWSPLERLFVERLRHEAERDPENMGRPATPEGRESFSQYAAKRAQRYVEKRFLRLLWQAWRRSVGQPKTATHSRCADAPGQSPFLNCRG